MNMITYFNELVTKYFNNYLKKYFNNMNYTGKKGNFINYYNLYFLLKKQKALTLLLFIPCSFFLFLNW